MLKAKVIALRFLRAFISGFLASVTVVSLSSVTTWSELNTAMGALLLSGVIGGISGILSAGDKLIRWED